MWLLAPIGHAQKPPIVIVVNKANRVSSLSLVELRRIFTKQSQVWPGGEPIVPVEWEATSEIRRYFSQKVHRKSVREMTEFWVQQSVTVGVSPPSTQKSARAILRFVVSVPGAISYVPADEVDDTVKTIKVPGVN